VRRTVRSYVLRQGRVTGAQERALAELMPVYGIAYREETLDPRAVFGRTAPLALEIGSGMGDTTARIARERPDADFIAVEVHAPGVGSLLKLIERQDELRLPGRLVVTAVSARSRTRCSASSTS